MISTPGPLERSLVIRSTGLWLLVRLIIAVLWSVILLLAGVAAGHPLFLPPSAALVVIGVTVSLSWLVTRGWREDLMLANLGTPPWITASLMGLPPLALEVVIAQVASW